MFFVFFERLLFSYRIIFHDGLQHGNNTPEYRSQRVWFMPAFMHNMKAVGKNIKILKIYIGKFKNVA